MSLTRLYEQFAIVMLAPLPRHGLSSVSGSRLRVRTGWSLVGRSPLCVASPSVVLSRSGNIIEGLFKGMLWLWLLDAAGFCRIFASPQLLGCTFIFAEIVLGDMAAVISTIDLFRLHLLCHP